MRSPALPPVAAALAATLLLTLTACDPPKAGASAPVHCNVMIDPPHRDDDQKPRSIISKVRFWCEEPGPANLSLTLRMQKQSSSGTWVDIARTSFTASGAQTVRTGDERYRSRSVTVGCSTGMYRTMAAGSSTGHQLTTKYDLTGSRAANPCDPSIFATSH